MLLWEFIYVYALYDVVALSVSSSVSLLYYVRCCMLSRVVSVCPIGKLGRNQCTIRITPVGSSAVVLAVCLWKGPSDYGLLAMTSWLWWGLWLGDYDWDHDYWQSAMRKDKTFTSVQTTYPPEQLDLLALSHFLNECLGGTALWLYNPLPSTLTLTLWILIGTTYELFFPLMSQYDSSIRIHWLEIDLLCLHLIESYPPSRPRPGSPRPLDSFMLALDLDSRDGMNPASLHSVSHKAHHHHVPTLPPT